MSHRTRIRVYHVVIGAFTVSRIMDIGGGSTVLQIRNQKSRDEGRHEFNGQNGNQVLKGEIMLNPTSGSAGTRELSTKDQHMILTNQVP